MNTNFSILKKQGIFRSVPPKLYLVMAATEQHEKHQRRKLMQELNYSEMQVIEHLAWQLIQKPMDGLHHD